jgi:predicted nucleic acid-binding protein
MRVKLEADAVLTILSKCEKSEWSLVTSNIIRSELSKLKDILRLQKVNALVSLSNERLVATEAVIKKAEDYQAKGIKIYDSYHLAVAEENKCDVFLTTDDQFLKRAKEIDLNVTVDNPANWIVEVIL